MNISIVIPFYKEVDQIGRAIASVVVNMTNVSKFEIIISNDGPFSESEILSGIPKELRRYVTVIINDRDKGPGGARNTGLNASSGELIAFLDADDYWLPGKIDLQIEKIKENATFVATAYCFDVNRIQITPPKQVQAASDVFMFRGIGTSTVLVHRDLVARTRFKNIRFAQDIDYWYNLAKHREFKYSSVERVSVVYNTSGSTKNKWVQLKYFNQVLNQNDVGWRIQVQALVRYVSAGVWNHYFKKYRKSTYTGN
jgi:glycosyltransferase involved in cell wall biosynthesis